MEGEGVVPLTPPPICTQEFSGPDSRVENFLVKRGTLTDHDHQTGAVQGRNLVDMRNLYEKMSFLSNKIRNRIIKMVNGNGSMCQNVTVLHWNLGSKLWQRKVIEIEAVTIQYSPDIFVISEANLLETLSESERKIPGYRIILP